MPPKQKSEEDKGREGDLGESVNTRIGLNVVRTLGAPSNFRGVKVFPIGADTYRVNVMAGLEYGATRIVDSFFLTADEKGNVVTSSPKIVRRY